jgi:hypothetical protein
MPKNEEYKYIVEYRAWIEDDYRTQPFKTMLGAKAFYDFVAHDDSIAAAFLIDEESNERIAKTIKQGVNK